MDINFEAGTKLSFVILFFALFGFIEACIKVYHWFY